MSTEEARSQVPWEVELGIVLDTAAALLLRIAQGGEAPPQVTLADSGLTALCEEADDLLAEIVVIMGNRDILPRIRAWRNTWAEKTGAEHPYESVHNPTPFLSREA